VQAEEAAVGINVVIDPVDNPTLVSRETNGTFDTLLGGWSGSPAVDRNVYQFVATDGARNFGGYSNPRVDRILDEERVTNDLARQKALYDAAFHILLADRPIIFLLHPTSYAAVSASVTGAQMFSDIQLRIAFARY
jgi:peptide/nickel transport system substrate-binding protein